ncbi:hypothetical protein [Candidatus Regiella endosymbiont of Tuberolachnus salignus]
MKPPLGSQGVRPNERRQIYVIRARARSQQRGGFKGKGYMALLTK